MRSERDWFDAKRQDLKALEGVPGLRPPNRQHGWLLHRSHLPLLGEEVDENLSNRFDADAIAARLGDKFLPRPWQVDDVNWLEDRDGAVLANQMRLGKTLSAVADLPKKGRVLVVAPLSTRRVWTDWLAARFPGEEVAVLSGTKFDEDALEGRRLVWMHYGLLPHWVSAGLGAGRRIHTLILDEAHLLANRRSKRTQNAQILAAASERVRCLTGTPLWNKLDGLWTLLTLTNPAAWGTYYDFTARYCEGTPGVYGWNLGDPKRSPHLAELSARLEEVMRALVWADVGDVPPTDWRTEKISVPASVRRELDLAVMAGRDGTDRPTFVGDMARYRATLAPFKAKRAAKVACRLADRGMPSIVWVFHKESARIVRETASYPVFEVIGKVPERKREKVLDDWREAKNGILVMSILIGQAGIDLSHAEDAIFAELDYTPAVISQGAMRHFVPTRSSRVYFIIADHETDEELARVLTVKCETAKLVGAPASDVELGALLDVAPAREAADLNELAARVAAKVAEHGTTFEERIRAA